MKWIYLFVILSMFGCSQKHYIKSFLPIDVKKVERKKISLGIYDVNIPHYLDESKIIVKDKNKMIYKKIYAKDDYQDILTQRTITYLHLKFPNGSIGLYPWEFPQKIKNRLKIYIDDVYLEDKRIFLNLRYIYNGHERKIHLQNEIKSLDEEEIVKEFFRLYDMGLERIVRVL